MAKKPKIAVYEAGGIQSLDKIEFKTGERRGSQYDGIYAKLEKLKAGQVFTVEVPKGVDTRTFHNRTNAAIRRGPVQPPEGCIFRKRTTVDGLVAVCCLKSGESTAAVKPAKVKSKKGKKAAASNELPAHPQAE